MQPKIASFLKTPLTSVYSVEIDWVISIPDKMDLNLQFFGLCDLEILWMTSNFYTTLCIISKQTVNPNWSYSPETNKLGQNRRFFVPCDLKI